eukprot:Pgem_evm1s16248
MVVVPSLKRYHAMLDIYSLGDKGGKMNEESDQRFWNNFFKGYWHKLHPWYNVMNKHLVGLSPAGVAIKFKSAHIFHFT